MIRRDFIKLVATVPFLGSFAPKMNKDSNGAYLLESCDYVIGVGNSTIMYNLSDTGLLGDKTAYTKAEILRVDDMGRLVFEGKFTSNAANFAWNEVGLWMNGEFVKRRTINMGTKRRYQIWTINYIIEV